MLKKAQRLAALCAGLLIFACLPFQPAATQTQVPPSSNEEMRAITDWVYQCRGYMVPSSAPDWLRRQVDYHTGDSSSAGIAASTATGETARSLSRPEIALLNLSRLLSKERERYESKATVDRRLFLTTTIVTIALGFLTTVLVSLSSTEMGRASRFARTISILAIVFPALGTAWAAGLALFALSDDLNQSRRSLASATQLFKEVQFVVAMRQPCLVKNGEYDESEGGQFQSRLEVWHNNFTNLVIIATSPPADKPAAGGGQQGNASK